MKLSIVTVVFNRAGTITDALESLSRQRYPEVEHVIVDGASTDGTTALIEKHRAETSVFLSEPDQGIYDALNKGMALATGEVIGLLHSDDFFADEDVLGDVAAAFQDPGVDAVYGDLDYVSAEETSRVTRHWVAGTFHPRKLAQGWMPPHPTLFLRRSVIDRLGGYNTDLRIAADYDAILRYFKAGDISVHYINRVLVKMRVGGESNASLRKIVRKTREDYWALKKNKVGGVGSLLLKNVSKVPQFFARSSKP